MTAEEAEHRLENAKTFLRHCREQEADAIRSLASAREQHKRAREKHEALFVEAERLAYERGNAGRRAAL